MQAAGDQDFHEVRARLDRTSPVPLYHQIAETLRYGIATGAVGVQTRLPAVREAAASWGVNLHTVRRAYARLRELGLVEVRRPAGAIVIGSPGEASGVEEPAFLLRSHVRTGRMREARAGRSVSVVECSTRQSADLAAQVETRFDAVAEPWPLLREGEPPPGGILATYFHYTHVRSRWPHRAGDVAFAAITPDPALATRLSASGGVQAASVLDPDEVMAHNITGDVAALLAGHGIDVTRFTIDRSDDDGPPTAMLYSPRAWATASEEERGHPLAFEVRYVFGVGELEAAAAALGLSPREERA